MNVVFFHIATIGNYQHMVDNIIKLINTYLINNVDKVYLSYVGSGNIIDPGGKYEVIHLTTDLQSYEFPTLNYIKQYCNNHECNVLYLHTKGVTTPNNPCINDWREYMLYFLVEKNYDCLTALQYHDTCGVDLRSEPVKHYSGNFWWSKSSHIKTLPEFKDMPIVLTERHKAEFWVCHNGSNHSLWDCGIKQNERHLHRYPRERYIK